MHVYNRICYVLCFTVLSFDVLKSLCALVYPSVDGRMKVLDIMEETQPSPRSEMKENCPAYGNFPKYPL